MKPILISLICAFSMSQLAIAEAPDEALLMMCSACHALSEKDPAGIGPSLADIGGKAVASEVGYSYSQALGKLSFIWDKPSLAAWIYASESMAPGTAMRYHNSLTENEVNRLTELLIPDTQ
jgi:cytochrome c